MADDGLGLVYNKQDGTGAAWKAPLMNFQIPDYSAMKAKAVADKKAKDDADKKAALDLLKGEYTTYNTPQANSIIPYQRDFENDVTKSLIASQGKLPLEEQVEFQRRANKRNSLAKLYNAQGELYKKTLGLVESASADENFDKDLTRERLEIYNHPELATSQEYPEVEQQIGDIYTQLRANPQNKWQSDESLAGEAYGLWREKFGGQYLQAVERFDELKQIDKFQNARNIAETKFSEGVAQGKYTDVQKKQFLEDAANDLVAIDYGSNPSFRKEMKKQYDALPASEKKVIKSPEEYAQRRYKQHLVIDDTFRTSRESQPSGSIGFNTPEGVIVTAGENNLNYTYAPATPGGAGAIDPATDRGFTIAVGTKTNKKEPQFKTSGTTYYGINDITHPKKLTSTGDFTFQRVVKKPTFTEPLTLSSEDLAKIGGSKFMGIDVKSLKDEAKSGGGSVTLDIAGIPLSKGALSTIRALKKGNLVQDKVYVFGDLEFDEADVDNQVTVKKVKGVYLPEEDVRTPLTQELQGYDYLTDLNKVYPDADYAGSERGNAVPAKKPQSPQGGGGLTASEYYALPYAERRLYVPSGDKYVKK